MSNWRREHGGGKLVIYRKNGSVFNYQVNVNKELNESVTAYSESYDGGGFFSSCIYSGDDLQEALEKCDNHDEDNYARLSQDS